MRCSLIFLSCLAHLASYSVHGRDTTSNERPLCQQYRVLSALPWKAPGATRKTVLERIFQEPHTLVRREVIREYLHNALPTDEFPAALDECIALEQADFPGATAEFVMRAWAERDPATAILRCQTLFDLVIEGAPLGFGDWKTPIRVSCLEKPRASSYWFGSRGMVHACWKGLAAATLSPERRKELEATFMEAYVRRFHEKPPTDIEEPAQFWAHCFRLNYVQNPHTISADPALRADFLRLLAAPPEKIAGMLNWPSTPSEDVAFPRALIRWMNGDAKQAPRIVERVLEAYDPRHFYRDDTAVMDVIPTEFLVEWAILDTSGFLAWEQQKARGWRAKAVCQAFLPRKNQFDMPSRLWPLNDKSLQAQAEKLWMRLDPASALERPIRYGDESHIYDALDDLWTSAPPANYWRSAIAPYITLHRFGGVNEAHGVTTVWAPVDFAGMVRQYGLRSCLCAEDFDKSQLTQMFSNRRAMVNASALRNTLSALRTWAILRPTEMRAWIDAETFPPDLREALLWLLDHASGGFAVPEHPEAR